MINSILRAFGYYDSYGLKYTSSHLQEMQKIIATVPRSRQATYVDQVTKKAVDTGKYIEALINPGLRDMNPELFALLPYNTTAIGNVAYVAPNHPDKWYKDRAEQCLQKLADYELKKAEGK